MQRIVLSLEYEGSTFSGWQSQRHGNTVQDVLEHAVSIIAGMPIRVHCAGRTDAGVHAIAQIVHFDVSVERPLQAWVRGVNAHLPKSVAVHWAQRATSDFHARFCAVARRYRYILSNSPVRPGLDHGRVGWFHLPLNLNDMRIAASSLLGEHDFSAFRAAQCQAKSPIKILTQADISAQGNTLIFDFRANAFLHHMVRNLVGTLVAVGYGRQTIDGVAQLLASRDRRYAAPTFSPAGLYLCGIDYAEPWLVK